MILQHSEGVGVCGREGTGKLHLSWDESEITPVAVLLW